MSMRRDKLERIRKELDELNAAIDTLQATSVERIWLAEIRAFRAQYERFLRECEEEEQRDREGTVTSSKGAKAKAKGKAKAKAKATTKKPKAKGKAPAQ